MSRRMYSEEQLIRLIEEYAGGKEPELVDFGEMDETGKYILDSGEFPFESGNKYIIEVSIDGDSNKQQRVFYYVYGQYDFNSYSETDAATFVVEVSDSGIENLTYETVGDFNIVKIYKL